MEFRDHKNDVKSKRFGRNIKVIILLAVLLFLAIMAIILWLYIRTRSSIESTNSQTSSSSTQENVKIEDLAVNDVFCQDILPNITSLDDQKTVEFLQTKLKLWDFFWLLPESRYSCKSTSDDILVKIRQEAKEILQEGDLFCQEFENLPDENGPVIKYKHIINKPPINGGYRVRSLYAQLMIARFFQAIKRYMLASDEDRAKMYSSVRYELAAWRAASGMPHLGCPRRLTARIYDLDSAIRYILRSDDGWLSKVEKQTFIERETRRLNLKANQTYLDLVKSCVESGQEGQDCYKLGKDIYQFLKIHDHSELGVVGDYLRNHVSTKPSNITPLLWYNGNCNIQAAIQCLAPVQDDLDLQYLIIPKLQSQNQPRSNIYVSLMDTLNVINKRKPAPQEPYPFPELYQALTSQPDDGTFVSFRECAAPGKDSRKLLQYFINPLEAINRVFRLYESPFWIWIYSIGYDAGDDEEQIFLPDLDCFIERALILHKIQPLENLFSSPVPNRCIFFSGPKLLYIITEAKEGPVSNSIPQIWTFSINAGDQNGEDIVTMRYILRSALIYPPGHYSSVLHYGGIHSKDEWFFCDMNTCTPCLFDFPQGFRPDGSSYANGLIYERID